MDRRRLHHLQCDGEDEDLPIQWGAIWIRQARVWPFPVAGQYVAQSVSARWALFEPALARRLSVLRAADSAGAAEVTILLCFAEGGLVPADVAGLIAAAAAWLLG